MQLQHAILLGDRTCNSRNSLILRHANETCNSPGRFPVSIKEFKNEFVLSNRFYNEIVQSNRQNTIWGLEPGTTLKGVADAKYSLLRTLQRNLQVSK